MGIHTMACHGFIIPKNVLQAHLPEVIEYLDRNEKAFAQWLEDSHEGKEDKALSAQFLECLQKIKEWGSDRKLELTVDFTAMSHSNVSLKKELWVCYCENAYTLNPAFKAAGGRQFWWVIEV